MRGSALRLVDHRHHFLQRLHSQQPLRRKGVANLLNLWPVANGPELTVNGLNSGIAEAFSNPLQHIHEDFGTRALRSDLFGQDIASPSSTRSTTARPSRPPAIPSHLSTFSLREQVASLSETHIFSPDHCEQGDLRVLPRRVSISTARHDTCARLARSRTRPVGAVVVGGGTTLNGASQITNGGTNAGSNLTAVRNLFT